MKRKLFRIEVLLNDSPRGSRSEFTRELGVGAGTINHFYNTGSRTIGVQKKHTQAFNRCFETNFSYKELFSLED